MNSRQDNTSRELKFTSMLLPFAFVFIGLFIVIAIFLLIRKQTTGKREMRDKNQNKR